MTKKMEKLVNKYYEKMDSTVSVYKMGLFDKQEAIELIQREEKQFNELRFSMFAYDLLSEKDLMETTHTGTKKLFECMDKLN